MRDFTDALEKIEKKEFKIDDWTQIYERAKIYRSACGWESAAEDALKIRKNDLPLGNIQGIPNWKGKFYKDNWLWKGVKWLISMQTGAGLEIDLKSFGGLVTPAQDLLEQEVNYAFDAYRFQDACEDALYDKYYTGMGWVRGIWNTRAANANYATGTPRLEYVDCMNVFIDPSSRQRDKSDMRYLFHEDYVDIYELRRRYPKYRNKIQEVIDQKNPEVTNRSRIITLQYRKTVELDKVYIEDRNTGDKQEFLLDEWQEYTAEDAKKPETKALYRQYVDTFAPDPQNEKPLDFQDWLAQGGSLPEKVAIIGALTSEEQAVFQAIYLPDCNIVLEQPQYVGKNFTYNCLIGYHEPDCAYAYGLCHYMKDLLEVSIVLMTILTVQAVKTYKNEKLIQEDSLVNQETYLERGYEIGLNPVVRDEWQRTHPGQKAVENVPLPEFPQALQYLNEQLIQAQKSMTGAVDAAIGLQTYSGQSGIQVAQLQAASRTYQREDLEAYRRFVKQCVEWLKNQVVQFRNYPHQIQGLDMYNKSGLVDVATDITNRLNADNYYVEISIQDNQEVVKQIEREMAMNLFDKGLLAPLDLLNTLDQPNPERTVQEAEKYRGEREILEVIRQFPELQQQIMQYAQMAQQQGGQPGGAPAQNTTAMPA